MLEIERAAEGLAEVLVLRGRVDTGTAAALEKACLATIEAGSRRLLLDLAEVDFVSSAGLRVFLVAAKRLGSLDGRLALCRLGKAVADVLALSGFDRILITAPTRGEALARIN
jgi:anti-anti-sigma factor